MKKMIFAALIGIFVSAAAMAQVTQENLDSFKIGVTTQSEVIAKLGQPDGVKKTRYGTVLTYEKSETGFKPESFIPIVGGFIGGGTAKITSAQLEFDRREKLVSSELQNTGTKDKDPRW